LRLQALGQFDLMALPRPVSALQNPGDRFGLTLREREVLLLIARGANNAEVAAALSISPHTVDRHLENVFAKMKVGTRAQAVAQATSAGLIA
jgi:DNA-binding CsgD family transcriptional regulator